MLSENGQTILDLIVNHDCKSFAFDEFDEGIDYWYRVMSGSSFKHDESSKFKFDGRFLKSSDGTISYFETREDSLKASIYSSNEHDNNHMLTEWDSCFSPELDEIILTDEDRSYIMNTLLAMREL